MQKIIIERNEETGTCDVMDVTDENQALFPDCNIENCAQDWRGWWYKIGEVPEKPTEIKAEEMRRERDSLLLQTDKYMVSDYPITDEKRAKYQGYRQYLRDLPADESFPEVSILSFDEWTSQTEVTNETEETTDV